MVRFVLIEINSIAFC